MDLLFILKIKQHLFFKSTTFSLTTKLLKEHISDKKYIKVSILYKSKKNENYLKFRNPEIKE